MGRNASLVREASQAQVIEKGIFSFYLFFFFMFKGCFHSRETSL